MYLTIRLLCYTPFRLLCRSKIRLCTQNITQKGFYLNFLDIIILLGVNVYFKDLILKRDIVK